MQQNSNVSKLVEKSIPKTASDGRPYACGHLFHDHVPPHKRMVCPRLGTEALAAISFTFPVVMFLTFF